MNEMDTNETLQPVQNCLPDEIPETIDSLRFLLSEIYHKEDAENFTFEYNDDEIIMFYEYDFSTVVPICTVKLPVLTISPKNCTIDILRKACLNEFEKGKAALRQLLAGATRTLKKKIKHRSRFHLLKTSRQKNTFIISFIENEIQHLNTLVDKYNEKEYCFSEGMLDRVAYHFKKEMDSRYKKDFQVTKDVHPDIRTPEIRLNE